jgi:SAM-dependent methyltransferase
VSSLFLSEGATGEAQGRVMQGTLEGAMCGECCLCGRRIAPADRAFRCGDGLAFVECSECGVPSRTEPANAGALYDDDYSESITEGFRSEGSRAHARFTLRNLGRFCPERGRVLDVGCAGGDFLCVARDDGWDVRGVELQAASAQLARSKGITVYSPSMEQIPPDERFDAVTLLDVLEHVREPRAFLEHLCSHLKPGGPLYVETPNYASMFRRLLGRKWMAFVPHHEVLYSPGALACLLSESGLHVGYQRTYACSLFSYDGLRRMRIHEPAYNLAVLLLSASRKLHMAGIVESRAARLAVRGVSKVANWPFETLMGRLLGVGDQLVMIAERGRA